MSLSGSVSLDSLGAQGVNSVCSTRPKPLHTLESPLASPTLNLIWQQGAAGIENFAVEQLRGALLELITVHRHASSRAKSLSAQLLELGGDTQSEKHQQLLNLLHSSRTVNVDEGFAQFSSGQNNKRSFDENLKRKREDKKKRDKERKRKKKKRSGIEEKEVVKSPSSLWKSMDEYLRFPTLNDLDLLSSKVRDSMYSIPSLGRHFSEVWREYDEKTFPNKKKRKSYHTISRRFRPKSDLMAIPDLPLRKLVKGVDDQLRPKKVFQVHSLAQRVLAAVMPLPGVQTDASNSLPPSVKSTGGSGSSLEAPKPPPSVAPVAFAPVAGAEGSDVKVTSNPPTNLKAKSATVAKTSLEERVRLELRFLGLVPSTKSKKVDFTKAENRSDDDIASLLRQLQSQLRRVSQANRSRCQKILTAAAPMVGADKDLLRLHQAEQALEKVYSSRKTSWDDNAVIRAIENVDTALKMYKGLPVLSQTGTFYVPKPSDFAGMPRNRIPKDNQQTVRSSSSHDPSTDVKDVKKD